MVPLAEIDISENKLRNKGKLLDTLLLDRTTNQNIIWATDSYVTRGKEFASKKKVVPELVTGIYGKLIQPRAAKSLAEQRYRTREKGEVFTPLKIIDDMNKSIDWKSGFFPASKATWKDYVKDLRLELTCGEGPFIVSRYNPTAHTGKVIELQNRVGFLDRKLRVVSKYCDRPKDWLHWAKEAFKASYGYEWQGDNILIARENLLYSMLDYYSEKFGKNPNLKIQQEFAEIINWNIFQMDGIKYVIPMSCKHEIRTISGELTLFGETPDRVESYECEGCKFNHPNKHNGKYVRLMDWSTNKLIRFADIIEDLSTPLL
jgi:hypothetical protein